MGVDRAENAGRIADMILRTITSALRKIGAMVHRAVATKMDGNSNKEGDDASGKQSWILLLLSRICTDKASVGVVLCVIGIVAHQALGTVFPSSYGIPVSSDEAASLLGAGSCVGTYWRDCNDSPCSNQIMVLGSKRQWISAKPKGNLYCCNDSDNEACYALRIACVED